MKIQFILALLVAVSMAAPFRPGQSTSSLSSASFLDEQDLPTTVNENNDDDEADGYDQDALEDRDDDLRELMDAHKDNIRRYLGAKSSDRASGRYEASEDGSNLNTDVTDLEKDVYHRAMLTSLQRYQDAKAAKTKSLQQEFSSDEDLGSGDDYYDEPIPYDNRKIDVVNDRDYPEVNRLERSSPLTGSGYASRAGRGSGVQPVRAVRVLPASSVAQRARMAYGATAVPRYF